MAAESVPEADMHILDTRTIAGGLGSLVKKAHQWAVDGQEPATIIESLDHLVQREVVYFLVDTLEYLYKGGRIGNASFLIGSMLQVKPILGLVDGKVSAIEKQRTSTKAFNRLRDLVLENCPKGSQSLITVSHCGGKDRAELLAVKLSQVLDLESIPVYEVPPAIVVHSGPGIISVSYFHE